MTDPAAPVPAPVTVSMNSSWRVAFGWIALIFFGTIIVYLITYGKPDNSLHSSALSWSYLGVMAVLAAFGFGAVVEMVPYVFKK